MSDAERAKLRDITRVLVAEKTWEGVGGLFITDEVKLTVAAQAALLLLGMEHDYFDRVAAVVVYPGAFRTPVAEDGWEDDGLSEDPLSGQAVYRGPVILSWDEVLREGREPDDGHNVVVHEFAHQLDFLDGSTDGTPAINDPELLRRWGPIMQAAFDAHRRDLDRGVPGLFFTEHAGDDEAEFFADASEAFFCRPHDLEAEASEVFELLRRYYRLDPRRWFGDADAPRA